MLSWKNKYKNWNSFWWKFKNERRRNYVSNENLILTSNESHSIYFTPFIRETFRHALNIKISLSVFISYFNYIAIHTWNIYTRIREIGGVFQVCSIPSIGEKTFREYEGETVRGRERIAFHEGYHCSLYTFRN